MAFAGHQIATLQACKFLFFPLIGFGQSWNDECLIDRWVYTCIEKQNRFLQRRLWREFSTTSPLFSKISTVPGTTPTKTFPTFPRKFSTGKPLDPCIKSASRTKGAETSAILE